MADKEESVLPTSGVQAGATPVDTKQNGRPSSAKQGLHWFGHGASDCDYESEAASHPRHRHCDDEGSSSWTADDADYGSSSLDQGKDGAYHRDREERLRILKEKQNEDRQRKLEEIKQQAMAAQKFREQKEEERRKRMQELRIRDTDRRHQVEERKRQIWEAERDRREAILRKNQEREARIESKRKNERSSIIFAFGSSTPRMLEPGDTGSTYWSTRRATSTSNVMSLSLAPGPLTRRSSERELDGSKKRATSAGGVERKASQDQFKTSSSIYEVFQWGTTPPNSPIPCPPSYPIILESSDETDSAGGGSASARAGRKKTDLTPTIPSPRESAPSTPSGRGPGKSRASPGRAFSMSRLDILAQPRRPKVVTSEPTTQEPSLSRSMSTLPGVKLRKGTPTSRSMLQLGVGPVPPPRPTRAEKLRKLARQAQARSQSADQPPPSPGLRSGEVTPSRPQSSMSQHSVSSNLSTASASLRARATPRRPRPISIAVTGVSERMSLSAEHRNSKSPSVSASEKPPIPKVHVAKKPLGSKPETPKKATEKPKSTKSSAGTTPKTTPLQSPVVETDIMTSSMLAEDIKEEESAVTEESGVFESTDIEEQNTVEDPSIGNKEESIATQDESAIAEEKVISEPAHVEQPPAQPLTPDQPAPPPQSAPPSHPNQSATDIIADLTDAEMTSSVVAKTRITTEEEAKAALAERRRQAREQAEREAELERQRLEAERLAEEERLRLEEEEQRRMEEEQLRLLEEARKAEELRLQQAILEAQKREEEERKRVEEELRMKMEKEEAEKKAKEEAEKLRQEMELRLKKEEEDRQARRKRVEAIMLRTRGKGNTPTTTPTKDGDEAEESPLDETKVENSVKSQNDQFLNSERSHSEANTSIENIKQNGHHNGSVDTVMQNNVTNSLLDLDPVNEPVGQILELPSGNGKITDSQIQPPFIAFQEKKEPPTVNDLLS